MNWAPLFCSTHSSEVAAGKRQALSRSRSRPRRLRCHQPVKLIRYYLKRRIDAEYPVFLNIAKLSN